MRYFLLVYDRPTGKLLELNEFDPSERELAYAERNRLELHKQPRIEVVVLQSDSRTTLEKTHGRYFFSFQELAAGA